MINSERASTSYLLWVDSKPAILVDAGGGAFLRFGQAGAKPPPGPMNIGGRSVIPGRASLSSGGVRNELPPGMLAALILLGAGALSTLLPPVRRRVLARLGR